MKRTNTNLLALATLSLVLMPAMAHADTTQDTKSESSISTDNNGGYTEKNTQENTDAAGTTHSQEKTKKVSVDSNGNTTTKVDIKTSTDPKGLFNKTTTETKDTSTDKNGTTQNTHTKTVDGKTVEDDSQTKQQ